MPPRWWKSSEKTCSRSRGCAGAVRRPEHFQRASSKRGAVGCSAWSAPAPIRRASTSTVSTRARARATRHASENQRPSARPSRKGDSPPHPWSPACQRTHWCRDLEFTVPMPPVLVGLGPASSKGREQGGRTRTSLSNIGRAGTRARHQGAVTPPPFAPLCPSHVAGALLTSTPKQTDKPHRGVGVGAGVGEPSVLAQPSSFRQ